MAASVARLACVWALVVEAAACAASGPSLRRQMQDVIVQHLTDAGVTGVVATCPDKARAHRGDVVHCNASVDGVDLPFTVNFLDSRHFQADADRTFVAVERAEAQVARDLDAKSPGTSYTVDCGDRRLFVGDVGSTFDCTAQAAGDKQPLRLTVKVTSTAGTISYEGHE